ncbi:Chromosome partition protein smc [hydrothermal vent metagenome]|uniref:Chromosome partition protein smc n=1 Tax=hydrothermal vent metagenome TaxID=652676 RepID=A0A3B1CD16_9ZZZZ
MADAIRWVLGEQSAKIMRGSKMEDFIFNGSGGRKPTSFAEVSITISNEGGVITASPYAEYEDITVTRKLFRTGESEYCINKTPCRLKDVVDIFLDTGVSSRSFSIIEQAQISKIIDSKPYERRFIVEEAAGVMKYKSRRNAAINKLELAQQNLLRVQDILGELERQRNSLKRQAKKAEKYGALRAEIKNRGLNYYSMEYQDYMAELNKAEAELVLFREKEANLTAEYSTKRNEAESLSAQIIELERKLGTLKEERHGVSSTMERNDQGRSIMARQLEEMERANESSIQDIAELEGDIEKTSTVLVERASERESLNAEIIKATESLAEIHRSFDGLKAELVSRERAFEDGTRESMKVMEQMGAMQNTQASLKTRIEMSDAKVSSLAEREAETDEAMRTHEQTLKNLKSSLEELEKVTDKEKLQNGEIGAGLEQIVAEIKTVAESLRGVEDSIARKSSRLESLQELDKNLEGFGEGAKNVMKRREEGDEAFTSVRGLLADQLRVPEELEFAVAALLGGLIETVITESATSTIKAIELLKNEKLGRCGFVSPDVAPQRVSAEDMGDIPSLVGRVSDLVDFVGEVPAGVKALLDNAFIATDLDGALEIWGTKPGAITVVTKDGDLIDPAGVITGGAAIASAGSGIVSRKRLIDELLPEVDALEAEKVKTLDAKKRLEESANVARERLNASNDAMKKFEFQAFEFRKEVQKEEADFARGSRVKESLNAEQKRVVDEKSRIAQEETTIAEELLRLSSRKGELDSANVALRAEVEKRKADLDEVTSATREQEISLTSLRGKMDNLGLDIARLESGKIDLEGRVKRLKNSVEGFSLKRDETVASMESMLASNVELAQKKDSMTAQINELSSSVEEKIEIRRGLESSVKKLETEVNEVRALVSNLALKGSELKMRVENVIEKADHEFNIPEDDLQTTDVNDVDRDEVTSRLAYLRGELGRIGDVNMSALDEFEEVNERYEFLSAQHADLVSSITTLRKTIDNINATTGRMFNEAFKTISENFEIAFKRLFGGGRAEMRLIEVEGKSDLGIEIFAQPPGKKIQSMMLLSAGEKAMTAISLLFAVFLVKPSPFCLLDEVDAPLDEANIFRFRDMLMEMKERTQFIIITHSQKTMSFAERLYGVTQEEKGVSKILAVNLVDKERDVALAVA